MLTFFNTSTNLGKSDAFFASIDFVTTGSKICLIASNGSIGLEDTVSPANVSFNPIIPTMFPAFASSICNLTGPL